MTTPSPDTAASSWWAFWRRPPFAWPDPPRRMRGDLYVDADGHRYTTEPFGFDGEPWQGATILTPVTVQHLREQGKLPLREISVRQVPA